MAEFITAIPQTVEVNGNVLFADTVVEPCCKVRHREGSGIFTLKGGRYTVSFDGNIEVPTGQTPGEISLAIALNGEAIQSAVMTVTPAAVEEAFNVSKTIQIDVPCNCCYTLSVRNISTIPVVVDNANIITTRENV